MAVSTAVVTKREAVSAVMAAATAVKVVVSAAAKVRGDGVLFYFSISSLFDIFIIFWYFNSIQQW